MPDWFSLILPAIQTLQGLPHTALAVRELRGDEVARPEAVNAYLDFESSATEVIMSLHLITSVGLPPRLVGGLWGWPTVWRAFGDLRTSSTALVVAFGQIVMLGSYDVACAAAAAAEAIGHASSNLPQGGRRIESTPKWRDEIDAASGSLRAFLLAARRDLQLADLPERTSPES